MTEIRNPLTDALVSTAWLAQNMRRPEIKIIDASMFPPNISRNAKAEYAQHHIPGAVFFDIDEIADTASPLPHMLPSAERFASLVSALGLNSTDTIVAYDSQGLFSAPRAWWMMRAMGHEKVFVLDGGLPKWLAEGREVTAEIPSITPGSFSAHLNPALLRTAEEIAKDSSEGRSLILDARSPGRFTGDDLEIWPGRRSGHIPGACNLFFSTLIDPESKTLLPKEHLAQKFSAFDLRRPITVTCGSGISACVLAMALYQIGIRNASVYDGSWAEWGLPTPNRPIATG